MREIEKRERKKHRTGSIIRFLPKKKEYKENRSKSKRDSIEVLDRVI